MVVPLTTNTAHVSPFQMLVGPDEPGLVRAPKAQAEQVRSVSARRLDPEPVGKAGIETFCRI
ncbi:type II toxin-antitoxin system PemK/MazF family toxin [Rhodococcus enclensis]|nr:type II toxin-antitoxin system PemK/MazF family toxin [Rhodococcus qingshengii]MBT2274231.1 type II toxin-antitoxin system PemK/MazF family toxin [Rhodococcus qingshengii]